MGDEIRTIGGTPEEEPAGGRRLVAQQLGGATIWLEQAGAPTDDDVYPVVSLPDPREAFEHAGAFLRECVRIFDERIAELGQGPKEISVEFSLSFEARGKGALIPFLVTGETGAQTAIKVTAKWSPPAT